MAPHSARGSVRSVKIFDGNRRGEIILRTNEDPIQEITLKLSNDNDSAFFAMAAAVCSAVHYGGAAKPAQSPNLHVRYDDNDMEIDQLEFHWH